MIYELYFLDGGGGIKILLKIYHTYIICRLSQMY